MNNILTTNRMIKILNMTTVYHKDMPNHTAPINSNVCLLFLLPIILVFSITLPVFSKTFKAVTGDWRPYIFEEGDSVRLDLPGYSATIVIEAFRKMNHEIKIKTYSFARQIALVETGEADLLIGLYQSDAPQLRYPQEAIALSENCFFTRTGSHWNYQGVDSLDNITLGVIKGYTYGHADIDTYIASPSQGKVIEIAGSETQMVSRLFQLLLSDRIDAFPQDKAIINHYKRNNKDIPDYRVGTCFSKVLAYAAFSPKLAQVSELMKQFDQAVKQMRKKGRIREILAEYGAQDWVSHSTEQH